MIRNHFSRLTAIKLLSICSAISLFCLTATGQDSQKTVLRGKVLNENAEPLLNARVDISTAAPKSGRPVYCPSCYLDCQKWSKTDASGQFEIAKLDSTLKFRLVVTAAGYKTLQTQLICSPSRLAGVW